MRFLADVAEFATVGSIVKELDRTYRRTRAPFVPILSGVDWGAR